jgi:DNA polymerase III delta prime subunit
MAMPRRWALDLKTDLEAFKDKEVAWSDLSSRLLLSGPPGTGKTTFAKALCNTLQCSSDCDVGGEMVGDRRISAMCWQR